MGSNHRRRLVFISQYRVDQPKQNGSLCLLFRIQLNNSYRNTLTRSNSLRAQQKTRFIKFDYRKSLQSRSILIWQIVRINVLLEPTMCACAQLEPPGYSSCKQDDTRTLNGEMLIKSHDSFSYFNTSFIIAICRCKLFIRLRG